MRFPLEAGMEIRRVVARPHETRVYFDGVSVRCKVVEAVREMLDPEVDRAAAEFWEWVEDVELWGREDGEVVPLDEILRLTLLAKAGGRRPQLNDLHVL